jgi:hypothetical protein
VAVEKSRRFGAAVDRSNPEMKLKDFMTRARDLYLEIQHQQTLKRLGIAQLFSGTNQDRATWFTFYLTCFINLLMVRPMLSFAALDAQLLDAAPRLLVCAASGLDYMGTL